MVKRQISPSMKTFIVIHHDGILEILQITVDPDENITLLILRKELNN